MALENSLPSNTELRRRKQGLNQDEEKKEEEHVAALKTAKNDSSASPAPPAKAVWSSGVPFYPPQNKYWRIGNDWYDFTDFLKKHPGGSEVLLLSRDRFEDATFVFESHHHNYSKARKIIQKYKVDVPDKELLQHNVPNRLQDRQYVSERFHVDEQLNQNKSPNLLPDDAFYSILRQRVADHLKSVNSPHGYPTWFCVGFFWCNFAIWLLTQWQVYSTGNFAWSIVAGFVSAWLGAFGHNWVHQPKYKWWAVLSLDMVGFSSQAWFREHNLQHHMYTNTPWDNHFRGSDPFLKTDPTTERHPLQKIMAYITPILFCFALYVNYIVHTISTLKGEELFSIGKFILPAHFFLLANKWGLIQGVLLLFVQHAILGNYYFPIALMNHNTEHTLTVEQRNKSKDWGIAQLHSCADWSCDLKFWQAGIYLWLNFHTVHHLFPRIDFSHHPAIYKILVQTCKEFDVKYEISTAGQVYKEMVTSFRTPRSLGEEIFVYAGGRL